MDNAHIKEIWQVIRSCIIAAGKHLICLSEVECEHSKINYDIELDKLIVSILISKFKNATIISEESGLSGEPSSSLVFFVDPLDGSKAFLRGRDDFSISIAAAFEEQLIAAAVYAPFRFHSGDLIEWYVTSDLIRNGNVCSSLPSIKEWKDGHILIAPYQDWAMSIHDKLLHPGLPIIRASTAYRLALVASGDALATVNLISPLKVWDIAAGLAFLQAVNGILVDADGKPISIINNSLSKHNYRGYFAGNHKVTQLIQKRYSYFCNNNIFNHLLQRHLEN